MIAAAGLLRELKQAYRSYIEGNLEAFNTIIRRVCLEYGSDYSIVTDIENFTDTFKELLENDGRRIRARKNPEGD